MSQNLWVMLCLESWVISYDIVRPVVKIDEIEKIYTKVYQANQNNASIEEIDNHMEILRNRFEITEEAFYVDG